MELEIGSANVSMSNHDEKDLIFKDDFIIGNDII